VNTVGTRIRLPETFKGRLAAITCLGLLVRLAHLVLIAADNPLSGDAAAYHLAANLFADGLGFVFHHPFIRPVVIATAVSNLFSSVAFTMFPVLVLRHFEVGPIGWGLLLTAGSIGGILGALAAPWFARRFGAGHAIPVTYVVNAVSFVLPILTFHLPRTPALAVLTLSMVVGLFSIVSFNVVQVTMRQKQCPPRMIGRMTASIRVVIWGIGPLGALLSGVVAEHWGLEPAFWIGGIGNALGLLILMASPLWRMGDVPVVPSGRPPP